MSAIPLDNKIISGENWTVADKGEALISVEEKLGEELGLKLNDELTFSIADKNISAKIINFRSLNWTSFEPNFFVIFPPGILDDFPATYMTSFYLEKDNTFLLNQLLQKFPNATIIDIADILQKMQDLIGKIISAMQYLFLFSLGLGGLILIASIEASLDERRQTYRLLHVLGASRNYIYKSAVVEFVALTCLISLVSIGVAQLIVYVLSQRTCPVINDFCAQQSKC